MSRPLCHRCRRPASVCYCDRIPSIPSRTRVVFLQHPRERKVAIGTARMAHLALPNSELHQGVTFDDQPRVRELLSNPDSGLAVLYPAEGAVEPAAWPGPLPRTLVVIDGTWSQAKKVLSRNPALLALPRIGLRPSRPGNYRIRKEPAEHCLSTIEAVVEVLGQLEGDPHRFIPMLAAFDKMVDTQLERTAARSGPPRRRLPRTRPRKPWTPPELAGDPERLVLVYGEANAPAMSSPERWQPELVHLAAVRPATGERFEAVVAPRQRLAEGTPRHLELPAEALLAGESVPAMRERWRAFSRPGDVLGVWGGFTLDLLRAEGEPAAEFLNLRVLAARRLNARIGGMQAAAARLSAEPVEVWARGRAGRRLAALEQLFEALSREDAEPVPRREVAHDGRG